MSLVKVMRRPKKGWPWSIRKEEDDLQIKKTDDIFFVLLKNRQVLPTPSDGDLLVDFSKNRINEETMALLFDLVSLLNCINADISQRNRKFRLWCNKK